MALDPVPALNSALRRVSAWSVAFDSWSARMIRTIDGGMIWPRVPDALIVPVASAGLYLLRSITGSEISPMATTVAPTMPVVAASNAPTKTTEMPRPPGMRPKSWAMVISRSSAIFDRSSIMPMKMKSGIAISVSRSGSQ